MDSRFDARKDPRFKRLPVKRRKVVFDERFESIANINDTVLDPRTGKRKKVKSEAETFFLKENDSNQREAKKLRLSKSKIDSKSAETDEIKESIRENSSTSEGTEEPSGKFEWSDVSDSSDDESDEDEAIPEKTSVWDTVEDNIPMGGESCRLAVLGFDWDVVTSRDLFALFSSFIPEIPDAIKRIAIYMSDFGMQRLNYENMHGPALSLPKESAPFDASPINDDDDDDNEQDGEEQEQSPEVTEALRKYQRERSRYHFAIVECSSNKAAVALYDALEGVDCDFSVDSVDVRFVPEDHPAFTATFPRPPRCEAMSSCVDGYTPPESFTSALRHSKVRCTWDETPAPRKRRLTRRFNADELAELDLQDYLAPAGDSGEDDGEVLTIDDIELPTSIQKEQADNTVPELDDIDTYRSLLLGEDLAKKLITPPLEEDQELTITVEGGNNGEQKGEIENKEGSTPWTQYLEKRKLERKHKKAEMKEKALHQSSDQLEQSKKKQSTKTFPLIVIAPEQPTSSDILTNDDLDESLNLAAASNSDQEKVKKKSKKKQKKVSTDKEMLKPVDYSDERFKGLLNDPELALDGTNSKYKRP